MKELMIAATVSVVVNMACSGSAVAQDPATIADQDSQPSPAPDAGAAPAAAEASAAIAVPTPAPEPAPAQAASAQRKGIEEVIVTAQRREENLQDVAISITVFNPEQLANANITNSADLATYTPSLAINPRFGNENATFAIRGFVQDLRTTASVGTYFAEVVAPRGQTSQSSGDGAGPGALFDLQNVQVLKGPQGTLFGRNTTGGAVLIVPQKPTDEFEGYVEFSGGSDDALRGQAVLNVPVNKRFKLRFGIDSNERDGHLNNYTGIGADDLGNVHYTAYRLSGLVDITDTLENYTIATYVDSNTNGYTAQLFACNGINPANNPFYVFTGPGCQAQLADQAANGNDGFYDIASTIATPVTAIKEKRVINTTTWDLADGLTLKNILAYAHLKTANGSQIFGTNFKSDLLDPRREFVLGISVPNPDIPVTSQETWVEEVQVQGVSLNDRLIWQAGAYYEKSSPDGFSGNNSASFLSCELSTIEGDPSQYNCFDPLAGQLGSVLVQQYKTRYQNRAVYTQGTYELLDNLSMTAGIRYTWDKTEGYGIKTSHTFVGVVPLPPTTAIAEPKTDSEAATGVFELSYRPLDDVMTYAKYSRGYRQGSVSLASDPGIDTWDPEKVDTFEIGAKTSFDGPIPGRLNVAAFYNDFTDIQLQAGYVSPTSGTTTAIFNAGQATIAGVEAEAFFQLSQDLTASLSYSHLDTKLKEQEDRRAQVLQAGGAFAGLTYQPIADAGDSLPFAADHTVVTSLVYHLPLDERLGLIEIGATYVYTGERRAAASSATPFDVMDDFSLLNLNLNWIGILETPVDLAMFATNVLDEKYVTYVAGTYSIVGFESRQVGLPRAIGARLKYNFGAYAK